jgi:hypothetical protein
MNSGSRIRIKGQFREQVAVRCNQYSVPARFIGHQLRVKL